MRVGSVSALMSTLSREWALSESEARVKPEIRPPQFCRDPFAEISKWRYFGLHRRNLSGLQADPDMLRKQKSWASASKRKPSSLPNGIVQ